MTQHDISLNHFSLALKINSVVSKLNELIINAGEQGMMCNFHGMKHPSSNNLQVITISPEFLIIPS